MQARQPGLPAAAFEHPYQAPSRSSCLRRPSGGARGDPGGTGHGRGPADHRAAPPGRPVRDGGHATGRGRRATCAVGRSRGLRGPRTASRPVFTGDSQCKLAEPLAESTGPGREPPTPGWPDPVVSPPVGPPGCPPCSAPLSFVPQTDRSRLGSQGPSAFSAGIGKGPPASPGTSSTTTVRWTLLGPQPSPPERWYRVLASSAV